MLTKMMTAVVMTGALWVAGDATYKSIDCCQQGSDCCYPPSECCFSATKSRAGDCCSWGSDCCSSTRECCVPARSKSFAKATSCCATEYVYCTFTGEVYEGCCCDIVNGQYRCLVTGIVSDECCCIPLE